MEGFRRLRVAFASKTGESVHCIYCKVHAVRKDAPVTPNDRTLFTLGWPPYSNSEAIEELFSRAGHVTAVYLQASPGPVDPTKKCEDVCQGFKVGYVVFASEKDVDSALRLCHAPIPISCSVSSIGLRKWSREYLLQRPTLASLEEGAEEGVALYDRQQEEAGKVRLKVGQPDEDGWITVTRKTPRMVVRMVVSIDSSMMSRVMGKNWPY